jgi:hypothetical protein
LWSFNDLGIRRWSDGRSSAWWWDSVAPLVRCPGCAAVHWLADLQTLGEVPMEPIEVSRPMRALLRVTGDRQGRLAAISAWAALPSGLKDAQPGVNVEYRDLIVALEAVSRNIPKREIYVRRRIWWLSNDHQRLLESGECMADELIVPSEFAHENKLKLLDLLAGEGRNFVERGELLRQLGRFDESIGLLRSVKLDGFTEVDASKIERWAQKGETAVLLL